MDFDIEMEDAAVGETYPIEENGIHDILPEDDAQEPGEVEDDAPSAQGAQPGDQSLVLNKVHLRGLDSFKPDDIRAYAKEHYAAGTYERVEWIDDTSANLLFRTDAAAAEALVGICAVHIADPAQLPPGELLPGKPYSGKADASLQVRFALASDRKEVGAASRSRFYLLNPEYDPEERRRKGEFDGRGGRGKYRDRDGGGDRYRRDRRQRDYEEDEEIETFDVNLYDDDPASLAKRVSRPTDRRRRRYSRSRSRSRSSNSDSGRYARPNNRDKELFPDRKPRERNGGGGGALSARNRSASPVRSVDGDVAMDRDRDSDRRAGSRNRDKARSIKDRLSKREDNSTKELFPIKGRGSSKAQMDQVDPTERMTERLSDRIMRPEPAAENSGGGFSIRGMAGQRPDSEQGLSIKGSARELFPDKLNNAGKELFEDKLQGRGRPRQRAEDHFR